MAKSLEKLNDYLKPYYALISMIAFFGSMFIGVYKYIISPSDLRITIETERLQYPASIVDSYTDINNYLISKDTLTTEGTAIFSFLIRTTECKKITLKNTSDKTIKGVKFKQLNTDDLTAWGISSDYLSSEEAEELKKNFVFDKQSQMAYLINPVDIAPKSQIVIYVWGNFKTDLFNNDIISSFDNGEGHIERSYLITGMKGYFINYAFEFILIMVLIFCIVYYVGLKFAIETK